MAYDTDNNFPVSGVSGEALIATDYSSASQTHFQVLKLAFGPKDTGEPVRVESGDVNKALPVNVANTSITVGGSVSLSSGTSVNVANGVTFNGGTLNFRKLSAVGITFGPGVTQGGASGASYDSGFDSIRVVGISGAFPIGVTGTAFDIRKLSPGLSLTMGGTFGASDYDAIRVIGFSGAYPVETLLFGLTGITAGGFNRNNRLPMRVDSTGSLSVNIETFPTTSALPVTVNTAAYVSGGTSTSSGFSTRILRATRGALPVDTAGAIETDLNSEANAEDTVRVVGFSGAYPVETLLFGVSATTNKDIRNPLSVDGNGNLRVNVVVGTVGVTATVAGVTLGGAMTISGISLGIGNGLTFLNSGATGYTQVLQVQGYRYGWTGGGTTLGLQPIPIMTEVTGPLYIQNATGTSLTVTGGVRIVGVDSGLTIGVTSPLFTAMYNAVESPTSPTSASFRLSPNSALNTSLTDTATALSGLCGSVKTLSDVFVNAGANNVIADIGSVKALRVKVEDVVQPASVTAGRVTLSTTEGIQLGAFALESGVNLRSDLRNTTQTIFVSNTAVGASGGLGFPLYNGDQIFIETDNLNKIFVASTPAGATLYYIGS